MTACTAVVIRWARLEDVSFLETHTLNWLGSEEQRELSRWRHARRRLAWLVGRWLAKSVVWESTGAVQSVDTLNIQQATPKVEIPAEFSQLQILSRNEKEMGVRPKLRWTDAQTVGDLSISHDETRVLVAYSPDDHVRLGVDLVPTGELSGNFQQTWFTAQEQSAWKHQPQGEMLGWRWAVKEAFYKAVNQAQPFQPDVVEVLPRRGQQVELRWQGRECSDCVNLTTITLDQHSAVLVKWLLPVIENGKTHDILSTA